MYFNYRLNLFLEKKIVGEIVAGDIFVTRVVKREREKRRSKRNLRKRV